MISDPDIHWAATVIVKRYGTEADMQVSGRAGDLLERGDLAGAAIGHRILKAIEELQREPKESEEVN